MIEDLTFAEQKLINHIRRLDWGKIEITVKSGKPVMISVRQDIKLDILIEQGEVLKVT